MNCIEVNEKMADLFDTSVSREVKDELLAHFRECSDCRTLYEEMSKVMNELQPRVTVGAGRNFHTTILEQALQTGKPYRTRRERILPWMSPTWKKVAAVAAVLAVIFILVPVFNHSGSFQNKATAATTLLQNSIDALSKVKSVTMSFKVRTLEGDNFEYINTREKFVEHELWKVYGDPSKWRIQKPGRMVVMDGKNQYLYCDKIGMAMKAGPDAGYVDWMRILLHPEEILQKEQMNAQKNSTKYEVDTMGNTITLTIKAKAMGSFTNSYMLNTSIPESNNRRVYTFDKSTNLLRSMEIFVDSAGNSTKVLELSTIKYNEPVGDDIFTINLPENISWVNMKEVETQKGVECKTGGDAAKMFFTACHNEDWATVRKLIPGFLNFVQLQLGVKSQYGGLTIINLGKPFKSGNYPGEFIPYEVRFKNGYVKKWTLAVRNDNPEKKWFVDGGF